jgi:hypothetical protein
MMRGGIRSHPLPTLVTIALVASLAACSVVSTGSDFPSPTAIPTLNPNQLDLLRPSGAPARTPSRVPDPTPTSRPTPMPTPVDPALEAMLPTSLRGIPLQRASVPASLFTPAGDMCLLLCPDEPGRLATAAGLEIEDLTVGFAIPTQTSDLAVGVIAIRFPGVDTSRLVDIRVRAGGHTGVAPSPGSVETTTVHVGARTISWVTWPPFYQPRQGEYLTASGDVLFIIAGLPPSATGAVPDDVALMVRALP